MLTDHEHKILRAGAPFRVTDSTLTYLMWGREITIPIVIGEPRPFTPHSQLLYFTCPYCGEEHAHGLGGTRVPACTLVSLRDHPMAPWAEYYVRPRGNSGPFLGWGQIEYPAGFPRPAREPRADHRYAPAMEAANLPLYLALTGKG